VSCGEVYRIGMAIIPEKPSLDGLEAKWNARWQDQGIYRFDRSKTREEIYAIDTPPPTISGSLHLGTAFGYIQVDAIARFQRMRGREVFYPMGWDDNGLPTERRVQNYYGVRCDPSIPYEPDLVLTETGAAQGYRPISRPNFVELCQRLTAEFEHDFEQQWRTMGLSVDWSLTYATIDSRSRRIAQRAFLRNVRRGEAYATEAPTMWDVDFQTAVAQAEFEDRPTQAAYYRLAFPRVDGGDPVEIETTRPELLPSCVALVAHPDDDRYPALIGTHVHTPVFGVGVPVLAHHLADPDKGSGIAMICTFGDTTDVLWWRELNLATRSVIRRDGRLQEETPDWLSGAGAQAWTKLAGTFPNQARRHVLELLTEAGQLIGGPKPIIHEVKFYEKGERPLEIVTSRQWYLRNGARDAELRERLLRRGAQLRWYPDFMRLRYEHWVAGLNTDWLVSRQRYFGVPFPVWYPLDGAGEVSWDTPILPEEAILPIDPQTDVPPGYEEDQRGKPGGFIGDPDVMDTWATSSLTPQIAGGWGEDEDLFSRVFPTDLRPQGPEIIRTWLFSTLLRSELEHGVLPWRHATINGWILDPDRKKMSKSKDNVLTPMPLVTTYGADGLRYWACKGAPGTDTVADPAQMKVGRRLAVKILNAGNFVLGLSRTDETQPEETQPEEPLAEVTEGLDRAMLAQLATVIDDATAAFEAYHYHRALELAESFFWRFCDDYVELVKQRAYDEGPAARSARAALSIAHSILLRLLAPFLPFVTEEVWSWWQSSSVHRAAWPRSEDLREAVADADPAVLDVVRSVLSEIRKAKSEQRRSQRSEVARLVVEDNAEQLAVLPVGERDLIRAGSVRELVLREATVRRVTVELVPATDEVPGNTFASERPRLSSSRTSAHTSSGQ
jgi:valyl-tRNA synthetase